MSSSNWHVFFIWKQENSYWGFVDYAAILFGGTTFPQDKIPILHYLASLCPATTCGVVVVKALKDDSVIREAKNLGIA